jgi:hypothetical protein
VSEAPRPRCPRCGTPAVSGQEYCLECGARLGAAGGGSVLRAVRNHPWVAGWVAPSLLGLVIAVVGTGAAIAISGDREESAAPETLTGGSLTVTEDRSTLTAPEPTNAATTTASATTAPATTAAPPRPRSPGAVTWPRGQRGWTIVLLSLPQANGRAAAAAKAAEARRGGLRRVGILDSSRYASLHPDYYVVFTGVFETEVEAASALQRAKAVFPGAYQREIVP